MKKTLFILSFLILAIAAYAQPSKGSGLLYFPDSARLFSYTPNEQYGAEWAYLISDSTLYNWRRNLGAWKKYTTGKVYKINFISETPSISSPNEQDIAINSAKDTLAIYGSSGTWIVIPIGVGGGTDDQLLSVDSTGNTRQVTIEDGNSISFGIQDGDSSPTNEADTLTFTADSGGSNSLSNAGTLNIGGGFGINTIGSAGQVAAHADSSELATLSALRDSSAAIRDDFPVGGITDGDKGDISVISGVWEIDPGVVGQSEIATNGVGANEIEAGAVGSSEIAASGVNAGTYSGATVQVDQDGRIEVADSARVSVISTLADTLSLSPKLLDIFILASKDTMGVFGGGAWNLFVSGGDQGDGIYGRNDTIPDDRVAWVENDFTIAQYPSFYGYSMLDRTTRSIFTQNRELLISNPAEDDFVRIDVQQENGTKNTSLYAESPNGFAGMSVTEGPSPVIPTRINFSGERYGTGDFSFTFEAESGATYKDGTPDTLGLQYDADYSGTILNNDRSLPDVGSVKMMISDSLEANGSGNGFKDGSGTTPPGTILTPADSFTIAGNIHAILDTFAMVFGVDVGQGILDTTVRGTVFGYKNTDLGQRSYYAIGALSGLTNPGDRGYGIAEGLQLLDGSHSLFRNIYFTDDGRLVTNLRLLGTNGAGAGFTAQLDTVNNEYRFSINSEVNGQSEFSIQSITDADNPENSRAFIGRQPFGGGNYYGFFTLRDSLVIRWNGISQATFDGNSAKFHAPLGLHTWATGARPSSPYVGMTGYNTTIGAPETWTGSGWESLLGGGGGASQLTDLSDVSAATPTTNHALFGNGSTFASRALVESDISDFGSYQPVDADLTSIAALSTTSFGRGLLTETNASTARSTLGVDPAGTDNSTNVTLAGSLDYLQLSGQQITLQQIDLTADVSGILPEGNIPSIIARDSEVPTVDNTAYPSGWDGENDDAASKNALYDAFQAFKAHRISLTVDAAAETINLNSYYQAIVTIDNSAGEDVTLTINNEQTDNTLNTPVYTFLIKGAGEVTFPSEFDNYVTGSDLGTLTVSASATVVCTYESGSSYICVASIQ